MMLTPEFERPDARGAWTDGLVTRTGSQLDAKALRGRYEEYCRQQVTLLLEIIPREAVRPFYRRARTWATERGLHKTDDPMLTLRAFCRDVLPLPPFDVWLSDHEQHDPAHGGSDEKWASLAAEPMAPIAVEVRRIEHETEAWSGTLEVYRGGDAWRGLIRFEPDGKEGFFRTGEIFREDDLQALRRRFNSFTAPTMSAFLRSTLP